MSRRQSSRPSLQALPGRSSLALTLALLVPALGACSQRPLDVASVTPIERVPPFGPGAPPLLVPAGAGAPPALLSEPRPALIPVAEPPPALEVLNPPVQPQQPVAFVRRNSVPEPVLVYQPPERLTPPEHAPILPPPTDHGDRQQTLVEARTTHLVLGPGGTDQRRLVETIEDVGGGRPDAVHLEVKGGDRAAASAVLRTARRAGVDPMKTKHVSASGEAHLGRGRVEVLVVRFVAIPPTCTSQAIVGPSVQHNDFEISTGCSTRNNLAQMVSDPADLLMNNSRLPADGAHAVRAIEQYRGTAQSGRGTGGAGGGSSPGTSPVDAGGGTGGQVSTFLGAGGAVSR